MKVVEEVKMIEAESLVALLCLRLQPVVWNVPSHGVAAIRARILEPEPEFSAFQDKVAVPPLPDMKPDESIF